MRTIINLAISADGKIGTRSGGASKFTSRRDLERLWEIRNRADAIIVGRGTLEADNMSMTIPPEVIDGAQPSRIIVSRRGKFNFHHPVFQKEGGPIHLISTEAEITSPPEGVTCHHETLPTFFHRCDHDLGIKTLLCEGGGELVRAFAEKNWIDEINLTIAGHTLIGGADAPGILGQLSAHLPASTAFRITHFQPLENGECFLTYVREKELA